MSIATSSEVVESAQATHSTGRQFVVIHDNEGVCGEVFDTLSDREEAVSLAQACHIVDGESWYAAERFATFDDNGSKANVGEASKPESAVAVPQAHFGTICVEVGTTGFRPSGPQAKPPLVAERLSHRVARDLAIELNRESRSRGQGRWHFLIVAKNGWYGVLRIPIAPFRLPKDAESYRRCDEMVSLRGAATTAATALNREIFRVARAEAVESSYSRPPRRTV